MEDMELQNLWAEYDKKLEEAKLLNLQSWALNLQSKEAMQMQKAKSRLNRLAGFKLRVIVVGVAWLLLLVFLMCISYRWQGIIFNISVTMIAVITAISIITLIKHIVLIRQIDNSESIADTQQKLAALQASTIRSVGIAWLQMPFYSTFFLSPAMLHVMGAAGWVILIAVTGFFTVAAIWLFRNINYNNRHKKWFKLMFNGPDWVHVIKAMQFLEEVEEWKKDVV